MNDEAGPCGATQTAAEPDGVLTQPLRLLHRPAAAAAGTNTPPNEAAARHELTRHAVDPSYWPRAITLRAIIAASYCVLVPAGLLPMSNFWWAISGGTLLVYSLAMLALYLRYGVIRVYEELSPYADTLVVTLAVVALARPIYPIWMGYFLIIPSLANAHSTRYMLVFSLWSIGMFWLGLFILDVAGRAAIPWQFSTIVAIMAAFMALNSDIIATSNRKLRDMVLQASITDPLTGLANRRLFQSILESHAGIDTGPLAVLMFDVDNFKSINEAHGHMYADAVLVRIGEALRGSFPDADAVARFGGDEMVVLTHVASLDEAVDIGQRSLVRVHREAAVSMSAGLAVYRITAQTLEAAVRQADAALGHAKHTGKARLTAASALIAA